MVYSYPETNQMLRYPLAIFSYCEPIAKKMSWWLGIEHLSYEKNDIKCLAVVRNVDDFQMMPRIN